MVSERGNVASSRKLIMELKWRQKSHKCCIWHQNTVRKPVRHFINLGNQNPEREVVSHLSWPCSRYGFKSKDVSIHRCCHRWVLASSANNTLCHSLSVKAPCLICTKRLHNRQKKTRIRRQRTVSCSACISNTSMRKPYWISSSGLSSPWFLHYQTKYQLNLQPINQSDFACHFVFFRRTDIKNCAS